jgi:acyl carrier protein
MIPSYFVRLDRIPLTSNGKVDRKALDSYGKRLYLSTTYTPPQNEIEKKITNIWKEVLHLEKVGIHDNYFELGGTSLDILKINKRLAEIFHVNVPVVIMFIYTTVHSLADYLLHEAKEIRDRAAALKRGKQDKMQRLKRRRGNPDG